MTAPHPPTLSTPSDAAPSQEGEQAPAVPSDTSPPPSSAPNAQQPPPTEITPTSLELSTYEDTEHLLGDPSLVATAEEDNLSGEAAEQQSEPPGSDDESTGDSLSFKKGSKRRHRLVDARPPAPADITLEMVHPMDIQALDRKKLPIPGSSFGSGLTAATLRPALEPFLPLTRLMLVERQEKRSRVTYVALSSQDLLQYYWDRGRPILVAVVRNPALITLLKHDDMQLLIDLQNARISRHERQPYRDCLENATTWAELFENKSPGSEAIACFLSVCERTLRNTPKKKTPADSKGGAENEH